MWFELSWLSDRGLKGVFDFKREKTCPSTFFFFAFYLEIKWLSVRSKMNDKKRRPYKVNYNRFTYKVLFSSLFSFNSTFVTDVLQFYDGRFCDTWTNKGEYYVRNKVLLVWVEVERHGSSRPNSYSPSSSFGFCPTRLQSMNLCGFGPCFIFSSKFLPDSSLLLSSRSMWFKFGPVRFLVSEALFRFLFTLSLYT